MKTLFIDRRGVVLKVDGGALVFYENDARIATVPLKLLARVCMVSEVHLSASVLGKLGAEGVGVVILYGRKRAPVLLMPALRVDALRRVAQYQLSQDDAFCLRLARVWLKEKLCNQAAMLSDLGDVVLSAAAEQIANSALHTDAADSLASLRGIEGAAAARYFNAWAEYLPQSWHFSGRNRRPPRDGVNAFLSLGYTLLHFELVRECYMEGLDPFIGFYHQLAHGRESLASDLLEPLRPLYDAWLLKAVKSQLFRPEDCSLRDGACMLGKAARVRYFPAYEELLKTLRPQMRQSCRGLLRDLAEASGQSVEDFSLDEQIIIGADEAQDNLGTEDEMANCL